MAINDALQPVLTLLGDLAHQVEAGRHALRARAVPLVPATAAELLGPARSRGCWFSLDDGPPMRLVPLDLFGRAGSPTTELLAVRDPKRCFAQAQARARAEIRAERRRQDAGGRPA